MCLPGRNAPIRSPRNTNVHQKMKQEFYSAAKLLNNIKKLRKSLFIFVLSQLIFALLGVFAAIGICNMLQGDVTIEVGTWGEAILKGGFYLTIFIAVTGATYLLFNKLRSSVLTAAQLIFTKKLETSFLLMNRSSISSKEIQIVKSTIPETNTLLKEYRNEELYVIHQQVTALVSR